MIIKSTKMTTLPGFAFMVFAVMGMVAMTMPFGAVAHATVLDFNGNICSGGLACADGAPIDQTYGDIAGQLDVAYTHRVGNGNTAVDQPFLKWWDTQYSDLLNVAWGGFGDASGVAEIALIPVAGFQVTLNGLDLGAWPNANRPSQLTIFDSTYTPLQSTGPIIVSGAVHSHFAPGLTNANGLIIQWGPSAFNVGIDNVDFTVQRVGPSGVPEPSTWLLLGSGLAGLAAWRRRQID